MKLISADLPHKTEAGAVRLNIEGDAALAEAIDGMVRSARAFKPDAHIEAVMVQAMQTGVAEVLLGYRDDALLGPLITLGVGGVMAEVWRDAVTEVAPVDRATALRMIDAVRGLAPIRGWRGKAPADLDALARAIVALSSLASLTDPRVLEAEINPLIVTQRAVCAVDGLVVVQSDSA